MQALTEMTLDEYLAVLEWPAERVEWMDGRAWAMSGSTARHAAVTVNVLGHLVAALRGTGCRAINGDQRVNIDLAGSWLYPDAGVVCGDFVYAENDRHSITNPTVLIEVLSPSTRDFDQGAKFDCYRRLASLQHYVLVDPETRHVIHLARQAGGWFRLDIEEGAVDLSGVGIQIPLDAIYADLDAV
ncbi:MAG: Uma2 family endonuclease [Myxococcales bacterium]|nr:Uma2 family endonuclease [Myxococcales bacterium]MCB9668967.1 Uma2 family endonuclease [Alphaproteobacteria bacterium]MCB9691294.1 Uma2 family endonuclease [Alphaproteobacteria bacterium]